MKTTLLFFKGNKKLITHVFYLLLLVVNPVYSQTWTALGSDLNGNAVNDRFGWAVEISDDGTTMAVSAVGDEFHLGYVRIYKLVSGSWVQVGQDIMGEMPGEYFGWKLGLSADGNTVAISAPENGANGLNAGVVKIFHYVSGNWVPLGNFIYGQNAGDYTGMSLSLSADGLTVAIGSPQNDSNGSNSGMVQVFKYDAGNWTQLGTNILGKNDDDYSGTTLSLSGDGTKLAIGAPYSDSNGIDAGVVRVFELVNGSWIQSSIEIRGDGTNDWIGVNVKLNSDGTILAVSGTGIPTYGTSNGYVRILQKSGGSWIQLGNDILGQSPGDEFGRAIDLNTDGTVIAVGAKKNDNNGTNAGHVRVYQFTSGTWMKIGNDIVGEHTGDAAGSAVSISGNAAIVAVGSPNNDDTNTNAGQAQAYTLSTLDVADNNLSSVEIFPNPTDGPVYIKTDYAENLSLKVYDLNGRIIFKKEQISGPIYHFDLNGNPGIYLVEVIVDNKKPVTYKVIKR